LQEQCEQAAPGSSHECRSPAEGLSDQGSKRWSDNEPRREAHEYDRHALAHALHGDEPDDGGASQGKEPANGDAQEHAGGQQHEIVGCEGDCDVGRNHQGAEDQVDQLAVQATDDQGHRRRCDAGTQGCEGYRLTGGAFGDAEIGVHWREHRHGQQFAADQGKAAEGKRNDRKPGRERP
jgi:hypothetical protein